MAEYFTSCVMLELQYSSAEILTACPSSADDTTQLIRKMLEPIEWLEQQQIGYSEGRGVATEMLNDGSWLALGGVMVMEKQAEQREKRRTCQQLHIHRN